MKQILNDTKEIFIKDETIDQQETFLIQGSEVPYSEDRNDINRLRIEILNSFVREFSTYITVEHPM